MSSPLQKGVLQWKKKKGIEKRFFVLYPDCLEYFLEAKDHEAGQDARGRIAHSDIESFNVTDDGFRISVGGKDQEFVTEDSAAKGFAEELRRLVQSDKAAREGQVADATGSQDQATGSQEVSFSTSPVSMTQSPASLSALSPTRPFSPAAQAATDAWPASPDATLAASPTASGEVTPPQPDAATMSSPTVVDTPQQPAVSSTAPPATSQQTVEERGSSNDSPASSTAAGKEILSAPAASPTAEDVEKMVQESSPAASSAVPAWGRLAAASASEVQRPSVRSEKPICSGQLQVERKNKMVQRYFVLLPDRLHYFEDRNSSANGQEPRGYILLQDIVLFEEKEPKGFIIQSRNEDKALELFCSSDEELDTWMDAWSSVLKEKLGKSFVVHRRKQGEQDQQAPPNDEILKQGLLELVKDKKAEGRHFVLMANRFEYYNSAEDFAAGAKPRGLVAIKDVRSFEVTDGGMLIATLVDRTIRLRALSPEVAESWGERWASVLQVHGGQVIWSQPGADSSGGQAAHTTEEATLNRQRRTIEESRVPAIPFQEAPQTAEDATLNRRRRTIEESKVPAIPFQEVVPHVAPHAVPREAWPEGSSLLWQGRFELKDSSHPDGVLVLFVIFQDHMEYFLRPDPTASWTSVAGQDPAGRIMLREVADLEVLDTGFNVLLRHGTSFHLRTTDTASLNQCVEAFSKALADEGQPQLQIEARAGGEVPSTATTTTPGSSYSGTSTPTGWPVQEGMGPHPDLHQMANGEQKRGSRCPSRSSLRQSIQQTLKEPILHQGPLLVQKQRHQEGQVAARPEVLHMVAFRDRFEYYADKASMMSGAGPRGQVKATSVQQVRVQDAGFVLGMGKEGLNLRVPSGEDMQAWITTLWTVFDPDRLAQQGADAGAGTAAGSSRPALYKQRPAQTEEETAEGSRIPLRKMGSLWSKTDRLPEKPVSTAELMQEAADPRVEQWLSGLKDPPLHYGVLGFQTRGKMVMKYAVMLENCINIWDGALMAAAGRKPSEQIMLRSIRGVEAVFGGFILNCAGKRVGVHVSTNDELRSWSTALLGVITSASPTSSVANTRSLSQAGSSKPTRPVAEEDPSADPKRQRAHSAGWVPRVANLPPKTVGNSPARKTYFTQRSQGPCFVVKTHKACSELGEGLHGAYSKVMTHAGQPGGRHISQDIAGKVNECAKSPRVARSVAAEKNLTQKVTGTSPVCSPRQAVGSMTWLKVNHAEATPPPMTARSPMEVRRSQSPPYFVERSPTSPAAASSAMTPRTSASQRSPTAASAASPALRRTNSAPVTGKINQVLWSGADGANRPRAQQIHPCRHMVGKITDPGRQRAGWAQPARPASVDKVRGIAEKSAWHEHKAPAMV